MMYIQWELDERSSGLYYFFFQFYIIIFPLIIGYRSNYNDRALLELFYFVLVGASVIIVIFAKLKTNENGLKNYIVESSDKEIIHLRFRVCKQNASYTYGCIGLSLSLENTQNINTHALDCTYASKQSSREGKKKLEKREEKK